MGCFLQVSDLQEILVILIRGFYRKTRYTEKKTARKRRKHDIIKSYLSLGNK
jgi:hypothetical protein